MKFVLFVEGATERQSLPEFFKRWLDPRLPERIGFRVVRFEGWRDYCDEIAKKVALNLSGRAGSDVIAGFGLLDLYGPTFYPGHLRTAAERYHWAKDHLEQRVAHPRFHQHFAVHETEAWVLAQPEILPPEIRRALPGVSTQPETVNLDEPPARLLARLYRQKLGKSYRKVIDGADLFQALSPERAAERCPNLRRLLDDMLSLARSQG